MTTSVTLPALGESVTEGTVTRWLKSVGDLVTVDEALLEVSTDKVDTEIPAPVGGTLLEITAHEDDTVEVGGQLGVIGEESSTSSTGAVEVPPASTREIDKPEPPDTPSPPANGGEAPVAHVTPLIRKMARENNVDLSTVTGTGVGGRIRKQDMMDAIAPAPSAAPVEAPAAPSSPTPKSPAPTPPAAPSAAPTPSVPTSAASAPPAAAPAGPPNPLRGTTEPMTRLRKVIASRMVASLQTSAQLTQVVEVDVTVTGRLRDSVKADFMAREGVKLSYFPFFAKATIDALKSHPKLNATIDDDKAEVTYFDHEHLAIAVDTPRGLLTPVIRDAGDLSVAGLARKIADLAERTRTNKIAPDDLAGGTFTLTNTGSVGALFDTPIINMPQVAILGTGTVVKRAVVIDDVNLGETIAIRQMAYLSLSYDHRLVDGADAARFLQDVKQRLQAGQFEL